MSSNEGTAENRAAAEVVVDFIDGCRESDVDAEEGARLLLGAYRALSDAGWDQVRSHLREGVPPTDLDESETLWCAAWQAATQVNFDEEPALKARALGLATAVPWPEFQGEGTWTEVTQGMEAELALIRRHYEAGVELSVADLSFLSDCGKSAGGGNLFYLDESIRVLVTDPFAALRVPLPGAGHVLTSMTAVSLLTSSESVAQATSDALTRSGALINPRVIELFCNDQGEPEPWWRDLQQWRYVLATWKTVNADYFLPGENDFYLLEQYRRSLNWSLYAVPNTVGLLRQDESRLLPLLDFLASNW